MAITKTGPSRFLSSLVYKGVIDASGNPNYPAASQGDIYVISVAGKIGGGAGTAVEVGDMLIAKVNTAAGTEAAVGANWDIVQQSATSVSGTGVSGQIPIFNGVHSLAGNSSFTFDSATASLTLGAAASISSKLNVRETSTLAAGQRNGFAAEIYLNSAVNSSAQFSASQFTVSDLGGTAGLTYSGPILGLSGFVNLSLANTYSSPGITGVTGQIALSNGTFSGEFHGVFGNINATSGTISTIEGVKAGLNVTGANVTTAIALHARAITGVLTGSITTAYGAKIDAPGLGTTQWTLAVDVGNSYIAGPLSLGKATAPGAQLDILQATASSGLPTAFKLTGAAHAGLDGDDYTSALFDFGQTVTFIQNDHSQFQNIKFNPSTYAFAGASNLTFASNVVINGVPGQGANASILAAIGLQVNGGSASNTDGSAVGVYVGLPGIANGIAGMQATQAITIGQGSGNQVGLGNQTAALVDLIYTSIMPDTVVSAVHTRTVSGVIAGLRISGPPVAGANVTFSAPAYSALIESGLSKFAGGIITKNSTANVSTPPTAAELTAAFGSPSTVQAGFMGTVNDNGAGTAVYDVTSDGTNWWYSLMTKAL